VKINRPRLFAASCIAMVTLAVTFAVRVDTLSAVGVEFDLSHQQQGLIITAVSWAYPAAIFVVGPMCDALGMGRLLILASVVHVAGITLTVFSPAFGFPVLLFATVLIGLADGVAEAVFNPLVTTIYPEDKTGRLTRLHAFWPAGLVLGGIACLALSPLFGLNRPGVSAEAVSLSWKVKFASPSSRRACTARWRTGRSFPRPSGPPPGCRRRTCSGRPCGPGFSSSWVAWSSPP
jgi:MFS family permease